MHSFARLLVHLSGSGVSLTFADFAFYECGVLASVAVIPSQRAKEEGRLLNTQPVRQPRRWFGKTGVAMSLYIHMYALYFLLYVRYYLPAFSNRRRFAARIDELGIADNCRVVRWRGLAGESMISL